MPKDVIAGRRELPPSMRGLVRAEGTLEGARCGRAGDHSRNAGRPT
jgi:hypothetical protein